MPHYRVRRHQRSNQPCTHVDSSPRFHQPNLPSQPPHVQKHRSAACVSIAPRVRSRRCWCWRICFSRRWDSDSPTLPSISFTCLPAQPDIQVTASPKPPPPPPRRHISPIPAIHSNNSASTPITPPPSPQTQSAHSPPPNQRPSLWVKAPQSVHRHYKPPSD